MKRKFIYLWATLLFCGVVAAQNQNDNQAFLDAQFLILDQIQPLMQEERERIDSLFYVEYAVSNSQNIAFNVAMSRTLENLEYYEQYYKDEITKRAWFLYNEEVAFYRKKMGLNDFSLESIKQHLIERSREIALREVCIFAYPDDLFDVKEQLIKKYDKDISSVYIKNESKGASYNLGLILQNRERLKLTEQQVNDIVDAVHKIKEMSDDGTITEQWNNCWLCERLFILEILSEEQVGEFVVIRYTEDAAKYAMKMWKEGKSYNIEAASDSVKVLNELYHYRINKLKIDYIHYNDEVQKQEMANFWYREAYPKFLSQLMAERRRREVEEADDKDNFRF